MRNAKFWINKTSNQNIEGFTIELSCKKEVFLSRSSFWEKSLRSAPSSDKD
jgi:hypothetical protein